MSPDTTLPADWKPLREAAEANAREAHNLFAFLTWSVADGWSELYDDAQDTLVRVHVALLADLTRPASRDFWARWLAERVGMRCDACAPWWVRSEERRRTVWRLASWSADVDVQFVDDGALAALLPERVHLVPGISTLTDPAAALRAALLAVVPA